MQQLKRLFAISFIVIIAMPLFAQNQKRIQNFIISVWPEYDHPGVLVIFNGDVPASELPISVEYPVPEDAKFALVAGSTDSTANKVIPVQIQDTDHGKVIAFNAVHPSFHVEFYFNPFGTDKTHRQYDYTFTSNLPIDSMIVDYQEPMASENFKPDVETDHKLQDSHGITYYRKHYLNVKAGQPIEVKAEYDNPTGEMTNDLLQKKLGQSGGNGSGGMTGSGGEGSQVKMQSPTNKNSFWILIIIIALVLVVLYFVTQSKGRTPREETPASPEQATPSEEDQVATTEVDHKFCTTCGHAIPQDAKFCTKCGAEQPE